MSAKKLSGVLVGEEVIDKLVHTWMCGFTSGAASALSTYGKGVTPEACDEMADYLADGLRDDRLSMEELRREVIEVLTGSDTGLKTWNLPSDGAAS